MFCSFPGMTADRTQLATSLAHCNYIRFFSFARSRARNVAGVAPRDAVFPLRQAVDVTVGRNDLMVGTFEGPLPPLPIIMPSSSCRRPLGNHAGMTSIGSSMTAMPHFEHRGNRRIKNQSQAVERCISPDRHDFFLVYAKPHGAPHVGTECLLPSELLCRQCGGVKRLGIGNFRSVENFNAVSFPGPGAFGRLLHLKSYLENLPDRSWCPTFSNTS